MLTLKDIVDRVAAEARKQPAVNDVRQCLAYASALRDLRYGLVVIGEGTHHVGATDGDGFAKYSLELSYLDRIGTDDDTLTVQTAAMEVLCNIVKGVTDGGDGKVWLEEGYIDMAPVTGTGTDRTTGMSATVTFVTERNICVEIFSEN